MQDVTISAFFDELQKIAGLPLAAAQLVGGIDRMKKGTRKYRQVMHAIEEGYPASWVALGIRPRQDLPY